MVLIEVLQFIEEIYRGLHVILYLELDTAIDIRSGAIRSDVIISEPHFIHTGIGI